MSEGNVAVLGLGIMGAGMARRLLDAGYDVTVWNRSPAKAEPLVAAGATAASTPAEAAAGADLVVAMLADDAASRAAWLGESGALGAMAEGAIAIESSTLSAGWVRELAAEAAERGVGVLDAPVTGSKVQANEGTLKFLVGGEEGVLARAKPVLAAMGSEAIHLGPTGAGATYKLVNNFLCGVQVASLAEAFAMLERSGLDVPRAIEMLGAGAPGSPILKMVAQRMVDEAYAPNFLVPLMAKDLAYAIATFAEADIALPSAEAAKARFDAAAAAGFAESDIAAVVAPLRQG
jgi:3-hydroxyisobutyrate dehydrogenase